MNVFRPSKQVAEQESARLNTTSLPRDVAATIAGVTRTIFEGEQLPQILESFCEGACHLLGADRSLFARVEAGEREPIWKILHAHNLPGDFLKKIETSDGLLSSPISSHTKRNVEILQHQGAEPNIPGADNNGKKLHETTCIIPWIVKDKASGILVFFHSTPLEYRTEELQLTAALADLASIAIEKSIRSDEQRKEEANREIAEKIAGILKSTATPNGRFKTVVAEIRRTVPCERCVIAGIDPGTGKYRIWSEESDIDLPPIQECSRKMESWRAQIFEICKAKKVLSIPDLQTSSFPSPRREEFIDSGIRSILHIPILQADHCIAHLSLFSTRPNAFTDEHVALLKLIGENLGCAIQNGYLYTAAEARASRLAALNELNQKINQNLNLSEVLDNIARCGNDLLNADITRIFLFEENSPTLLLAASHSQMPGPSNKKFEFKLGEGIIGTAVESGEAVRIADVEKEPLWATPDWSDELNLHAYIGQPLQLFGKTIGGINCVSRKIDFFSEEDLDLLGALASQAALAIQNARLHDEEKRSRRFFESVVADNADAITVTDPEWNLIHWNAGAERLFGYTEKEALGKYLTGLVVPKEERDDWLRTTGEEIREVLRSGKSFQFEADRCRKNGAVVPLSITISPVLNDSKEVVAVSTVYKDLTELRRAEKEREHHVERLKSLGLLQQNISASLDLQEVLDFIVASAAELLDVLHTRIFILKDGILEMKAEHGAFTSPKKTKSLRLDEGAMGWTANTGEACYIEDIWKDERWLETDWVREEGIRTYLGLPLKSEGKVLGVLNFLTVGIRKFREDEFELASAFANGASVALHNARLHDEEKRSSLFLQSVVGDSAYAILVTNLDRNIILWNKAAEELFGYQKSEVLGKNVSLIIPKEEADAVDARIAKTLQSGEPYKFDTYRLRKDETRVPISITTSPVKQEGGEIIATSTFYKDLTEHKRIEDVLRRQAVIFDQMSEGVIVTGLDGTIIDWNPAAEKIFGFRKKEAVGKKTDIFRDSREDTSVRKNLIHDLLEKGIWSGEIKFIRKDGIQGVCETVVVPLRDEKGRPVATIGVNRDITERKATEDALRESEVRIRAILESAPDGIITIDTAGIIESANPAAENMFGYKADEMIGRNISFLMPNPYKREHDSYLKNYLTTGQAKVIGIGQEVAGQRKNGAIFPLDLTLSEVRLDERLLFTGIVKDVTERKNIEKRLHQRDKLEALGQLASGVAHDFNNVLSVILGRAELIRLSRTSLDINRAMEIIEKAALSGASTVKRLQDFARKRERLTDELVNLNEVALDVIEMTRPRWKDESEGRGISIELRFFSQADGTTFQGNYAEIQEALINLINNAVDAMPEGGQITISTEGKFSEARIAVEDTGKGMEPEELDRIFEPFFTTKGEQGMGLGLSMVFGIVEAHGGTIEAKSEMNVGTKVLLAFPKGTIKARNKPNGKILPARPSRIIVFEDNPGISSSIGETLVRAGHQVEVYTNAKAGLVRLRETSFDLVLTDLGMPGITGWDVGKR